MPRPPREISKASREASGEGAYASLPRWREPEVIAALARLVVYRRPGGGGLRA